MTQNSVGVDGSALVAGAPRPRKRRIRSMLFVPGSRPDWIVQVPGRYSPDALIIDWEDALALDQRPEARRRLPEIVTAFADAPVEVYVRINSWGSGHTWADLDSVVIAGIHGLGLSKSTPEGIRALDFAMTDLEIARGLPVGAIDILPMPESATGMLRRYEALLASPRCRRTCGIAGSAPGGDLYRSTGYRWRRDGLEAYANNTTATLEARAAGIESILCGPVTDVDDLDYVREVFNRARDQGATGSLMIHPSHVAIAHEVFTPSPEEIDEATRILNSMAQGISEGRAAVRVDGRMVDYAHVRSSLDLLELAEEAGIAVPDYPRIEVTSLSARPARPAEGIFPEDSQR